MFINCPSCRKDCEPLIDTSTLKNSKELVDTTKVICAGCKKEMKVTAFIKKSLFSMKKFYIKKPKKAFEYDCAVCNDFCSATLKEDQAFCVVCGNKLSLTPFMISALRLAKKDD